MPQYGYDIRVTELIEPTQLATILEAMPPHPDRQERQALIAILYLTGGRISEALDLKPANIEKRTVYGSVANSTPIAVITMKVLKKRKDAFRTIPLYMDDEERDLVRKYVKPYLEAITLKRGLNGVLFKHSRYWAVDVVQEVLKKSPHWFRHHKMYYLLRKKKMRIDVAMQYMKWSKDAYKLALGYAEASPEMYLDEMLKDVAATKKVQQ